MSTKSVTMTVRVTPQTHKDLEKASAAIGVSTADLVRLAITGLLSHGYLESPLDAKVPKTLKRKAVA